ncbi:hypothetical protein Tco_1054116 [Tanacetum coccineum]|uniref:Uncharacterized protein n=1 Tax=Tanacetum coccineum TaxID=301880 RepID=A0ABQ5GWR8_9ASTR
MNPSSPKCVHFINSVVILRTEDEVMGEENVKPNVIKCNDHEMTAKAKEKVEEESEDEFEEEIEEKEEEDIEYFDTFPTLEELGYHEWLLKYPKPSWVKAKIKIGSLNNVKFSCMIGHFEKKQAYIDLESTTNVMSRLHYNWIMSGRLIYDMKEGIVAFEVDNEKLNIFKMPHKMEMFKNVDVTGVSTDSIPPFVVGGDDDGNEKTHYSDSLNLGPELVPSCYVIFDFEPLSLSFDFGFTAALAILVTGGSQSRQHESHHQFFPVDTSLIHKESHKSPTKSLFDVGSSGISIFTVNTEVSLGCSGIITRIMRRTLVNSL